MRPLQALPRTGRDLADWVAERPQPYTAAELIGVSSRQSLRSAVARGDIVRLLPDCYVSHLYAESFHARCAAALAWAGQGAAVSGAAALHLWDVLPEAPAQVELVVRPDFRRSTPNWLRIVRTETPSTVRHRHWHIVPVATALAQGYGQLDPDDRTVVLQEAILRRRVSSDDVLRACAELPRVPRRRELLRRVTRIERGAESYLEELVHAHVFNTAEFADLIPQFVLRVHGRTYRADLYDPTSRTAVELDGARFHSDPASRLRDVRRDAELATMGVLTVRFTYRDLTDRPEWCRQRLGAILRARRPNRG